MPRLLVRRTGEWEQSPGRTGHCRALLYPRFFGGAAMTGRPRCLAIVLAVLVAGGCGAPEPKPAAATVAARDVRPAGVEDPAGPPKATTDSTECGDPRASLRPGPLPPPGQMPPG